MADHGCTTGKRLCVLSNGDGVFCPCIIYIAIDPGIDEGNARRNVV